MTDNLYDCGKLQGSISSRRWDLKMVLKADHLIWNSLQVIRQTVILHISIMVHLMFLNLILMRENWWYRADN